MPEVHRSGAGRGRTEPGRRRNGATGGRTVRGHRPARRSPWVKAGRVAVGVTSAAILLASGVTWATFTWINGGLNTSDALDAANKGAPRHLDNSVNLLLIGLDSRKDMNGNDLPRQFVQNQLHAGSSDIGYYNTNTLILMHIPADGGKVTAFSVPRDDYVQTFNGDGTVQGHYKIKEAYANAYTSAHDRLSAQGDKGPDLEAQSREAGREATLVTVQKFLDVPVDHFAEVNLLGFYDIAKVVQPIQVCLQHPVHDRYSGANFPAGLQELNPKQALAFVRQRHGLLMGDLDRTHRQQAFLSSVTHKLKTDGVFSDLGKLQGLFGVVKKDLVIDSKLNVLDFAQQATNLTGGKVEFHTLPIAGFAHRNNEEVNLVDPERIRSIVQAMIGHDASASPSDGAGVGKPSSAAPAAPATVDVLNGSGRTGAAATELRSLAALGYTAGRTSNAATRHGTTIVYGSGAQAAARQIADRLGTAAPVASPSVPAGRVQITLGTDFTPPAANSTGSSGSKATTPGSEPSPIPSTAFAGDSVKMGGIPCVN
ncbi:LCP family protein [Streptomyces broussonetiae]|uniref:LytR family transcriptional regulator n=1 Tax=Streptomyces broussonetiae TaxID=2686304 RepID=A0A6I6MSP0_9ACTN|nr:LCP family protein [Streptomyces broussonetiae]QHA02004.1 LytR family transcriptional regulator [Streptomyces broussonetiae]